MIAATVRCPGARIAPTISTLAQSHTRSENTGSNSRNTSTIAGGRSRMAHPFLQFRCESSVACLSCSVYRMDKAELKSEAFCLRRPAMTKGPPCPPAPGPLEAYAAQHDDRLDTRAPRRRFREYLQGLSLACAQRKTLTGLVGTEPVVGA